MSDLFHEPFAKTVILSAAMLVAAAAAPAAGPVRGTGTLTIEVGNVRNSQGKIHVDVCPQAQFLKEDCPFAAEVPAHAGSTLVTLHGLPPGRFAVQATHDENGNGKVDRGLLGVPKEGIGFSRDARIAFGPPKWDDAVITFDGRAGRTALHMRYLLGPSGPASR